MIRNRCTVGCADRTLHRFAGWPVVSRMWRHLDPGGLADRESVQIYERMDSIHWAVYNNFKLLNTFKPLLRAVHVDASTSHRDLPT